MPKAAPNLTNFTAGEWSPRLKGRVDLAKYYNASEIMENMTVFPHGGSTQRFGSYFVATVKDQSKKTRLIPFQFSTEQAYILEFSDLFMRVYMDKGQVMGNGSPYQIATLYTEAMLFDLQYAQSADLMYMVHLDHSPRKLTRTGHTSWTLTPVEFIDGPYLPENKTAVTLTPSAVTGDITVTASAAIFEEGHVGSLWRFKHNTVWGYWVVTKRNSSTEIEATVKKDLDGFGVAKTTWREGAWSDVRGFPSCVSFYERRLWFGGTYYEPDKFWGSKPFEHEDMTPGAEDDDGISYSLGADEVNAITWMSAGKNLGVGTTGGEFPARSSKTDEPITPTNIQAKREETKGGAYIMPVRIGQEAMFVQKAGLKVMSFRWSWEAEGFVCIDMTLLAEHITEGGITQMAYQQEPDSVLWAIRDDGVLLGMTYQREHDVIGWHRHVTDGEFESVAVIPGVGHDEVWVVVKRIIDGNTKRYVEYFNRVNYKTDQRNAFFVDSGLTYYDPKTVTGATKADPVVITAVAHGLSNGDFVRMDQIVGMTELNGRSYEIANKTADDFELKDCDGTGFTTYESGGVAEKMVTALTGLGHLKLKTVQILTDGAVHPPKVVSADGEITLDYKSAKTHVGLGFSGKLQPMELEVGSQLGTSQGEMKRIYKAVVKLYKSLGFKIGPDEAHLDQIPFRTSDDPMGQPPALFTGNKIVKFPGTYDEEATILIVQDQPLPLTVLSIAPKLNVSMGG